MFNYIRKSWTVFHNGCTIVHPRQHCLSSSCSRSLPTCGIVGLLSLAIPVGVKCYCTVVLICISWLTQWSWAIFICLLAICNLLLWHVWSSILLTFICCEVFLFWSIIIDLLVLFIYSAYQNFVRYIFCEYFCVDELTYFLNNVFWLKKFFLMKSILSIYF